MNYLSNCVGSGWL